MTDDLDSDLAAAIAASFAETAAGGGAGIDATSAAPVQRAPLDPEPPAGPGR
jgi:hypothetical protein